jgi:hypothetical protein
MVKGVKDRLCSRLRKKMKIVLSGFFPEITDFIPEMLKRRTPFLYILRPDFGAD